MGEGKRESSARHKEKREMLAAVVAIQFHSATRPRAHETISRLDSPPAPDLSKKLKRNSVIWNDYLSKMMKLIFIAYEINIFQKTMRVRILGKRRSQEITRPRTFETLNLLISNWRNPHLSLHVFCVAHRETDANSISITCD